jgi:hypothetical protein
MFKWWQLHPMIAPLPRGFADEDTSHKQAKEWMNRATDHIEQLEAALDQLLDDMGEDGLCVCQQAKDEARAALGEKKDGQD